MTQGIYRSAGAMLTEMLREDIHSNNLANASTNGFKRSLGAVVSGGDATAQQWVSRSVDLTPGRLEMTNSPLDLALTGSGYFVVAGANGNTYTRDGKFLRDSQGYLVDSQGQRVQGQQGDIRLSGTDITVTSAGAVVSGGQVVDTLRVVDFPRTSAVGVAAGAQITGTATPVAVANPGVVQGALETSNVNPVMELSAIRNGYRIYEANARAVTQVDQSLQRLIESATG
jgi:flagellar basal-body rod protein FlgF